MKTQAPSSTARKVAMNVLALGSRSGLQDVLPPGSAAATARLLVAAGVAGPRTVRFARSRGAVWTYRAFDWLLPGQFEAFAHRKAFCERQVRKALAGGARQVLVLGAGYDTLGWRLAPEFPGVRFCEIDHPPTARRKATAVAALGEPANLALVAVDLGETHLADVLAGLPSWDREAPAVVVAEGLLMYLPPAAVGALLRQAAATTGEGSRIAFTYVGRRPDGRPDAGPWTGLVLRILAAGGEPWLWSVEPDELEPFLLAHGWTPDPDQTRGQARRGVEFFGAAVRSPCPTAFEPDRRPT